MTVLRRRHESRSGAAPAPDRQPDRQQALAVLTGARAVVARGWLQGSWYVLEAPDGARRVVGAGSMARRGQGVVAQACLVGALVEAARRHTDERGAAGPAVDELWCALQVSAGRGFDTPVPSPWARRLRAQELIRWNDDEGRTRDDVLRLLEVAVARLAPAAAPPAGHQSCTVPSASRLNGR